MKFLAFFLLLALSPVANANSIQPPTNKINSNPTCPPCPSISQDPSSPPAHETQPEQPRNALPLLPVTNPQAAGEPNPSPRPPFPVTNPQAAGEPNFENQNSPVPVKTYPNSNQPLLPVTNYQAAEEPNLPPLAHQAQPKQPRNPIPPFPVTNPSPAEEPNPNPRFPSTRFHQSPDVPFPSTLSQLPVAIEAAAPHGPLPFEFEVMDNLRLSVLSYFFASGLSYTSSWGQRPHFSTSIQIQCFITQLSFSLFLLANTVFPRTHPALALMLHRLSVLLMIISGYLASMPMHPPYIAIIMFVVVVLIYIINRITRD